MLLLVIAAAMQSPAQPPVVAACELDLFALKLGAPAGFKGNMLVKPLPASGDPLAFINVVSPYERMNDLTDDEYRRALNLPSTTPVVRHWEVPIERSVRKSASAIIPGSKCRVELVGYDSSAMQYKRSRLGKDEVAISFLYREFGPGGNIVFKYDGGGYAAIKALEKTARTDREAALTDLKNGSREIISDFGKGLVKRRAKLAAKN